jgi:hypothetical protein
MVIYNDWEEANLGKNDWEKRYYLSLTIPLAGSQTGEAVEQTLCRAILVVRGMKACFIHAAKPEKQGSEWSKLPARLDDGILGWKAIP